MLIQNINNQNLYRPCSTNNLYRNSCVNFCGDTEKDIIDKFVKDVNDGSIKEESDVSHFIRKHNLMGLYGVINYQAIVSAITDQIITLKKRTKDFNTEHNTKLKALNNQEQEIKTELRLAKEKAFQTIYNEPFPAATELREEINQFENSLSEKRAKLDKKALNIGSMFASEDRLLAKETAAKYNIAPPQIYTALGDQMPIIAEFLLKNSQKIKDTTSSTPDDFLTALQNNREEISSEMINFIKKLIPKSDEPISINLLIDAINSVKDIEGNLDYKKAALFIASYSYTADISNALDIMKQVYDANFEQSSEHSAESDSSEKA